MVRQQMLCVVTPDWAGDPAGVPALAADLDLLFTQLGCVHFACLALLPPRPGVPAPQQPTLMLELAIDEGISTPALLQLLTARGSAVLWRLYFGAQAGAPAPAEREPRLLDWLTRHTHGADGGFVGARDRSVQQILDERTLYLRARRHALALRDQAAVRAAGERRMNNDELARQMALWAQSQEDLDWARRAAPRCFWRNDGLRRLLLGTVLGLLALAFILNVLPLALSLVHGWLTDEVQRSCVGFRHWMATVAVTLALLLAVLVLLALLAVLLAPLWLAVATAARALWRRVDRLVARGRSFRHARASREVPRAHQVHPSVLACEAQLKDQDRDRPSHMLSLTEVRAPVYWQVAWLRLWLRLITWIGRWAFAHGVLGNASGIKYGHWHIIEGGRRLLFCSNYDGPFGGYLDEFIAGATWGVNLFWRRTRLLRREAAWLGQPAVVLDRDFPPTRFWATRGGCEHEQWFKAYARDSMLPHLYLFQAYPLSQVEIERATALRDALFGSRNAVNDDIVARALES